MRFHHLLPEAGDTCRTPVDADSMAAGFGG
jgi:hypothetical protein